MISICSFVEKGSILRILTDGASTGLGELSGQSVLKVEEIQKDESKYVLLNYVNYTLCFKASTTRKPVTKTQVIDRLK